MRTATILVAAAATLTAAAATAAPAERSFTRDGHTYVYTTSALDSARTVIEGHEVGRGGRFRLVVNGDRVSGQANGVPVSFRAAQPLSTTIVGAAN
ncbi:hypothetical protein K7957_05920 [Sphingomonas yunnanensis]|uniref:hypothetical protein n=1 Tax=Sphingomonas yunnanensis TaxID=310400 RepID=UPI001CA6A2D0|nr:hypothetical protein [Sphingomonas yunnanensis]MBY9062465.1 hypothetical protein [Sphingomonas yunnanensis]